MDKEIYSDKEKFIEDYLSNVRKNLSENLDKIPNKELPFMEPHLRALYFEIYFLFKKIRQMLIKQKNKSNKKWGFGEIYTGLVSGVVQGAGLPGGGMRNSYLLSEGLTLAEMNGTTNLIGIFITMITTYTLVTGKLLSFSDFNIFIWIAPLMIFTTWLSRHAILKVNEKYMDWLVIYSMVGIVVFLILRMFGIV